MEGLTMITYDNVSDQDLNEFKRWCQDKAADLQVERL